MYRKMAKLSALVVFGVTLIVGTDAMAARINGKVTYVGTMGEYHTSSEGYQATFRFRVSESTCGTDTAPKDRWIHVRSGRMDGVYAHNSANLKNAFTTVMTAMLSGKIIEVDGAPDCNATQVQTINLWNSQIGLFK